MGFQQLLHQSPTSSDIQWDGTFPEGAKDMMGHTARVVTLDAVPFIAYRRVSENPADPVYPLDSVDVRLLNIIAHQLNFTYEMREPWDGTWGVPLAGGNWSGIVGTLQHEEADFSLNLTPSPARMEVITHSIIYNRDPLQIVSLKPGPLPRHLALIRPFTDLVWVMVIVSTVASGVAQWLLQKMWSWASGQGSIRIDSALFDSWSALLQEAITEVPANISGQVFVGWWWMTCVVIGTAYTSSLIAHLSVQSKFPPIDIFQDLLDREGWSWGIHALHGTTFLYFNQSTDPITQGIYHKLKTYSFKDGFERVLSGGFSFITFKLYIRVGTAGYQDKYGLTPFYLSTTEYPVFGGNSWGFRKGAPFLGEVRMIKQRLIDAGLVDYLTNDAIETYIRNNRQKKGVEAFVYSEVEDGQVVLGLDHLQGVFYLLFLGYVIALATFLAEELTYQRIPK
ncbi:probable glutamate receptor [Panulirus ornatus]|uniref:probable glutamate receptor n=1 Tax=Panulirus ornatus TaxID=150431 RepID=UPI003A867069